MGLRKSVLVGGCLAASVASVGSVASIALAQAGVSTPLFPAQTNRNTPSLITSSVTTGGVTEGSPASLQVRPSKASGMTVTANGATIEFTRSVYLRITLEEAGAKLTMTHYNTVPAAEKPEKHKTRFQSSAGNLVFSVFNDSAGKDLLAKVRASDITYTCTRDETPGAVPTK